MYWNMAFSTLGGLGLFLFGIQIMASGMQKAAGDRFRKILEVLTNNPVLGVLTGIIVTILVQSSSTSTVMVVGFANAGLMNLAQAVSVIIGANIGTTVTAQIVSFKVGVIALPAIGIGSIMNFFGRRKFHRYVGQTVLGVGLLFLGMTTMSNGMYPLRELEGFHYLLAQFSEHPILGIIAGAIFTALIQSSSASTGVIIALTMQDLIPFHSAVPLILGTNIGTCITAMLASIGASVAARRAAIAHVLFNVIGVILALLLLKPFTDIIIETASTVPRQVANAHTIFNVLNTVVFLVFLKYFTRLICVIVPGVDEKIEFGPKYLDPRILKTPSIAIGGAKQELLRMAGIAREMLDESMQVFLKNDLKRIKHIEQMEELVDGLEKEINVYLADLSQHSMSQEQSKTVANLMSAANDLERIGDHAENIMQLAELKTEERLPFSATALEEITEFYNKVNSMLERAIKAFELEDKESARLIVREDDEVDEQEKTLRKKHIDRINTKKCYPASGVIYLDFLSNLERVADHANNIAYLVLED
ncbi:MAG: Na/Pi cotransporter family protein [Bacillota bacterium]|nr:Na/Pi cotransporter family protein [Bacillota bacterium]